MHTIFKYLKRPRKVLKLQGIEGMWCGFANHFARLCPLWRIACLWKLYGNYCVKIQSKWVFFVFVFLGELPHDRSEMYSVGWFIFHFPLQFSFVLCFGQPATNTRNKKPVFLSPIFLISCSCKERKMIINKWLH